MSNHTKVIREMLIKEWFNTPMSEVNSILLLENATGDLEVQLSHLLPIPSFNQQAIYRILDMRTEMNYSNINGPQKVIIIISPDKSKKQLLNVDFNRLLMFHFLYIPAEHTEFYFNIGNYINHSLTHNSTPISIPDNEKHQYFIERVGPYDLLINNRNFLWINEYLIFMLNRYSIFWNEDKYDSLLVKGTTFKEKTYSTDMKNDISLFVSSNILTSRLAVIVYRIAFIDLEANTTKIGIYFHKISGTKSKTLNFKTHKIRRLPDLLKPSFKAYDFNVNDVEVNIRKEIAMKLLSLDINELDAKVIAEVTGYPKGRLKT